jgi:hypothetical protein
MTLESFGGASQAHGRRTATTRAFTLLLARVYGPPGRVVVLPRAGASHTKPVNPQARRRPQQSTPCPPARWSATPSRRRAWGPFEAEPENQHPGGAGRVEHRGRNRCRRGGAVLLAADESSRRCGAMVAEVRETPEEAREETPAPAETDARGAGYFATGSSVRGGDG